MDGSLLLVRHPNANGSLKEVSVQALWCDEAPGVAHESFTARRGGGIVS